jgi:hypothetical protein
VTPPLCDVTPASGLLWSFTEINVRHEPLQAALAAELHDRVARGLEPRALAQVASAAAVLGLGDGALRGALVESLNAISGQALGALAMPTLTQMHLFAWEYEHFEHATPPPSPGLARRPTAAAARRAARGDGGDGAAADDAAAEGDAGAAEAGEAGIREGAAPPPAPQPAARPVVRLALRVAAQRAMVEGARPVSSFYHRLLSSSLDALGVHHANEHVVQELGLGYCVDLAFPAQRYARAAGVMAGGGERGTLKWERASGRGRGGGRDGGLEDGWRRGGTGAGGEGGREGGLPVALAAPAGSARDPHASNDGRPCAALAERAWFQRRHRQCR